MISSTSSSSSSSETQTSDAETKPTNVELGNNKPMSNLYSIPTKTNKITDYKSFIEVVYYIMNSKVWFISYGVVIIINLILLIWMFSKPESTKSAGFIFLDLCINLILIFEIYIKISYEKKKYFKSCENMVDLIVCTLCVIAFILFTSRQTKEKEAEEAISVIFRIFRDCSQILRIIVLLKNQKKNYLKASTDVKFHPESNKNKSGDHDDKLNTPLLKSSEENSEDDIL
ncbi:hypothetical protein M0812_05597 [Anaeramoeba flamelloides]|uniref:Ion transport domain-containing protein n=1 Tax=Anaeramoeba flamelloides TaxID=1746091 RepID=A0AAV8AAB7_9EUKA|nr:hypothetical protein M0812_05597 [Anaeramoeba flamelloides]